MRVQPLTRTAVGITILTGLLALALAGTAHAAQRHWRHHQWPNHSLTIAATPDPITAGQSMLIYGQLNGPSSANRLIVLYHRVNPAAQFTVIGATRTNAQGFYEFTRAEGVVVSNRNWFVVGPWGSRSPVVHEFVSP
ncbi:MAG: hypothetical protein FWD04_00670, partial [Conexibacteraceae bacterium]|nr:hypothetical protein [Conexibacteraceae bacterium]